MGNQKNMLLEFRDITIAHRVEQDAAPRIVVDQVSLSIRAGTRTLIVGRSGAGKSSFLASLFTPDRGAPGLISGQILFHRKGEMQALFPEAPAPGQGWSWARRVRRWQRRCRATIAPLLGRDLLLVPQGQNLFVPDRTIGAQIAEALRRQRLSATREEMAALIEPFDLPAAILEQPATHRSPGERQRIYLALAQRLRPAILCLDEPTSGLDPPNRIKVVERFLKRDEAQGLVVVSHDLALIDHVDEIVVFYRGHVVERCPAQKFRDGTRPMHPYTAALLSADRTLREARSVESSAWSASGDTPNGGCPYRVECKPLEGLAKSDPDRVEPCHKARPESSFQQDVVIHCWHPNLAGSIGSAQGGSPKAFESGTGDLVIYAKRLSRHLDHGRRSLFHDVSLPVQQGEDIAIVGPSGGGKTQFAKVLCGLVAAQAGQVVLHNLVPGAEQLTLNGTRRSRQIHNRLCYFSQDADDLMRPEQRVDDLLASAYKLGCALHDYKTSYKEARREVEALLGELGLPHLAAKRASELANSGGEKTRIALARTLFSIGYPKAGRSVPHVLVADEPVTSLDVEARVAVLSLLDKARAELNLTLIVVTHEIEVARWLAKTIYVLTDERLMGPLSPSVYAESGEDLDVFRSSLRTDPQLSTQIKDFLAPPRGAI